MELEFAERSVTGNVRPSNQDRVLATAAVGTETWVLAVADGVGGLVDGAEASSLTIDGLKAAAVGGGGPLAPRLEARVIECNSEIFNRGEANGRPSATTVVILAIEGGEFSALHAGDSRAYLMRDGRIERLTEDHSWVAEQVRAGSLSPEEAAANPYRNVITRAVGVEPSLSVERGESRPCLRGDIYLLCSDGLHGLIDDSTIATSMALGGGPAVIADRLVELAIAAGGTDNISVVVGVVTA